MLAEKNIESDWGSPAKQSIQQEVNSSRHEIENSLAMELEQQLNRQVQEVQSGNNESILRMLQAQAFVLNNIFVRYANKNYEFPSANKIGMAIALRAQSQCKQTLSAMAEVAEQGK